MTARALVLLLVLAAAACAQREGAVSGSYVGGGAGTSLRPDSPLR